MTTDMITTFWETFLEDRKSRNLPLPVRYDAWHFCNDETSANNLADLVLAGQKKATASLFWEYEAEGSSVPKPGDLSIITRWDGTPVCIIETTEITIYPFDQVPESFAFDEGEGDRSLQYWKDVHLAYFTEECAAIGRTVEPSMPVVCERFRMIFRPTPK